MKFQVRCHVLRQNAGGEGIPARDEIVVEIEAENSSKAHKEANKRALAEPGVIRLLWTSSAPIMEERHE